MTPGRPITEDDLHAYVDGLLDPARIVELEVYLARTPDVARRVAAYAQQRQDLRDAVASYADEPVPPQLNLAHFTDRRPRVAWPRWQAAAAAVMLLALGGASGWMARGQIVTPMAGAAALAQEAAESYQVFGADPNRPVELKASDRGMLVNWMSQRLQHQIAVPDLSASGYRFMGGRLVATSHGPAALFFYDDDHGARLAMLVRPLAVDKDMPMTQHRTDGVDGFVWGAKGLGYSLVGGAAPDVLHPLANEVRRQIATIL